MSTTLLRDFGSMYHPTPTGTTVTIACDSVHVSDIYVTKIRAPTQENYAKGSKEACCSEFFGWGQKDCLKASTSS